MLLAIQTGRLPKISDQEIKSTLAARDVAPALAMTIIAQSPTIIHTEKLFTTWGQLPVDRLSSIAVMGLSNWLLALGGAIRLLELKGDSSAQPAVLPRDKVALSKTVVEWIAASLPPATGKINIGLSSLISSFGRRDLQQLMSNLKRELKEKGVSCRIVLPSSGNDLNAAAIKYNHLTEKGYEFVLYPLGSGQIGLGMTLAAYDPDRDRIIDREAPRSSGREGMLPLKLAKMMVNIAVAGEPVTVVDPFSGSGRVLMMAALKGIPVIGSDIEASQVAATQANLKWLETKEWLQLAPWPKTVEVEKRDARTKRTFHQPHVIVTEPWLGPPLRHRPAAAEARRYADQVIGMLRPAIRQWLASKPKRVVMVLPRWRLSGSDRTLDIVANIKEEFERGGYSCRFLETASRADAIVERDLVFAEPKQS